MSDPDISRKYLGRMVREAWVMWALTQPNPKASWLAPYDDLSEPDKEADRQIGETVWQAALDRAEAEKAAAVLEERATCTEELKLALAAAVEAAAQIAQDKSAELMAKADSCKRKALGLSRVGPLMVASQCAANIAAAIRAQVKP